MSKLAMANDKKTPFPEWLRNFLGDVHAIAKMKDQIAKHSKTLGLTGWHLDSDLRKQRKKLEDRILTILGYFLIIFWIW
jgi:vacuolar-type H+-ATPase subunit I/STV1